MIRARLIRSLAIGRALACDLLAAVPREEAAAQLRRKEGLIAELRGQVQLHADRCALLQDADMHRNALALDLEASQANERRLVDQLQRLEASLTAEQGLRASAERAVTEEQELAVQLRVRESTLREEVADLTKTRTKQRECLLQLRAELSALDQAARDVSAAAVAVELLDTAFAPAIAKLRDVLAARNAP